MKTLSKKTALTTALFASLISLQAHSTESKLIDAGRLSSRNEAVNVANLYNEAARRAAEQNLRIVYLGTADLDKDSANQSVLDKKGSRQIVITESNYQDKDMLVRLLANGNYVIALGNADINTTQSAFDMVQEIQDTGKLSKRADEYDVNQPRFQLTTGGDDGVESTTEGTLSAYFYSPRGSKSFYSANQDVYQAVTDALVWARDTALEEEIRASLPVSKALSFTEKLQRNYTVDCPTNISGASGAVGRLNVKTVYSQANNDGSSTKDFWEVRYIAQILPAQLVNPGGTGWGWKNEDLWVLGDANSGVSTGLLKDYGPTTTIGASSAGIELTASTGGGGISRNWSYTASDVEVRDYSDFSKQSVQWWHNINGSKPVGSSSYKVEPGALVELPQGTVAYNKMYEYHKGQWIIKTPDKTKWCAVSWN